MQKAFSFITRADKIVSGVVVEEASGLLCVGLGIAESKKTAVVLAGVLAGVGLCVLKDVLFDFLGCITSGFLKPVCVM